MNRLRIYVQDDFSVLQSLVEGEKELFLVYDRNVEWAAEQVKGLLCDVPGLRASLPIETGEHLKTMDSVMSICHFLLENGASRKALVLALGGGITTDMVGFAASIYKRGVRFANMPTTLLAQVDAAIGGKTGVNFENYKNILGVINQPEFTYIASHTLSTLSKEDMGSGIAELLKTFILVDAPHYHEAIDCLKAGNPLTTGLISAASMIKAGVVERDEKENGERRTLNFGHTVAHAIEWWQGEQETEFNYSHGEAVAIGMVEAARLSEKIGVCEKGLAGKLREDFKAVGLPTECPIPVQTIEKAIRQDKKAEGAGIHFILVNKIGKVEDRFMPVDEVIAGLA